MLPPYRGILFLREVAAACRCPSAERAVVAVDDGNAVGFLVHCRSFTFLRSCPSQSCIVLLLSTALFFTHRAEFSSTKIVSPWELVSRGN